MIMMMIIIELMYINQIPTIKQIICNQQKIQHLKHHYTKSTQLFPYKTHNQFQYLKLNNRIKPNHRSTYLLSRKCTICNSQNILIPKRQILTTILAIGTRYKPNAVVLASSLSIPEMQFRLILPNGGLPLSTLLRFELGDDLAHLDRRSSTRLASLF